MSLSLVATIVLAAAGAGGVVYALFYPMLSGAARVEKRQKALVGEAVSRRTERVQTVNRRDQVAQSLKDLEQRQKAKSRITIEQRIAQAGLTWSKKKFLAISVILGIGLGGLLFAGTQSPYTAAAGLFVGGFGLPRWVLGFLKKKRMNRYLEELPNAVDVIVRGIRSGLPLNDCMRIIATEAQEPVKSEFRHVIEQQTLGIPMAEAVMKLYERVPVAESNFFGIVISIQSKAGGNLSEALGNLSRVLRERKKMKGKIQAMSMEAKASAGIIAALPFVVGTLTWVTSPAYIELLWITSIGKVMLAISAFWMTMGCLVMRKMINFDF